MGVCGRPSSERFGDSLQHARPVQQDIVVPEAENSPAFQPQSGVSAVVVTRAGMQAAIGFDDQARFDASEIDDEGRDRKLSAEAPAEAVSTQFPPQRLLGISHISTQVPGLVALRYAAAHVLAARRYPHSNPPPQTGEGIRTALAHRVTKPFSTSSLIAAESRRAASPQPPPPPDSRTRRSPGRITRPVSLVLMARGG
jgi:hypothetical protein